MYIPRLLEEKVKLSLSNRKILLLLGARQVGKTTLIEHILSGTNGSLLNLDIDVDRAKLTAASKLSPSEAMRALHASRVLVVDEAHRLPNIGRICKGWYDAHVPTKIILLGSSSTNLLDTASAELAGRNEKLWLTPLLFSEILHQQSWHSDVYDPPALHRNFADQIKSLLLNRLVYGQYPEAYLADNPEQYLTNLSHDYLLKDIFTAYVVRSPEDVARLLIELSNELGNTVSILQLASRLQLSRQTIQRYLDLLSGIFVIFSLPAYATDPIKEVNKSQKYYFWDNGVINALNRQWSLSETRHDMNTLWQNWVIAEIFKQSKTLQRQEQLFFWQSRNNFTVDLVVKQGSKLHPFNISFNPSTAKPSRAFTNAYGVEPKIIHPGNILEFVV
jgi:predicted AAA+ superfamily ATPase